MPTTDWNWFFSSVAQSAAAIVGIFGAFIVTKILANQSAFSEKSRRMHELITSGEKLVDATSRLSIDWYHNHHSAREIEKLEKLLDEDGYDEPESLYEKLNFSPYIAKADAIQTIADAKSYREDRLRHELEESKRKMQKAGRFDLDFARPMISGLSTSMHMQPQLTKERDDIDTMYTEVKHHTRVVSDFHALVATHPESSRLITASLILILTLFFAGVIYPLSFMPLPTGWKPSLSFSEIPSFLFSLRGVLLTIVSILFTAMLTMFFFLNIQMRYPKTLIEQLEQYKDLTKYSQYFANREENVALRHMDRSNRRLNSDSLNNGDKLID